MTTLTRLQTWMFRDRKGQTAAVRMFITATAADVPATLVALNNAAGAITTPMTAASGAFLQTARGPQNTGPQAVQYPAAVAGEPYIDVEDKLVLVFSTAAGAIHRYQIPAPFRACFLGDDRTADFTAGGLVANLANAMTNVASDSAGVLLTQSLGGYRASRPRQRRFNVITRNPTLSGQGL